MRFKRIFLMVLDSLGVGEAMDATNYGDGGANTLGHIKDNYDLFIPNLAKIGFLNTLNMDENNDVDAYYTIARPNNAGKDTLAGHYEMMGITSNIPFKTFNENGFPIELIDEIETVTGRRVIGNKCSNDNSIINELGERQVDYGSLIVYTSADSDLQIAAHEDVISPETLYSYCEKVRELTLKDDMTYYLNEAVNQSITYYGTYEETEDEIIFHQEEMAGSDICTYLSSDETTMQKEDGNIITTFRGETATLRETNGASVSQQNDFGFHEKIYCRELLNPHTKESYFENDNIVLKLTENNIYLLDKNSDELELGTYEEENNTLNVTITNLCKKSTCTKKEENIVINITFYNKENPNFGSSDYILTLEESELDAILTSEEINNRIEQIKTTNTNVVTILVLIGAVVVVVIGLLVNKNYVKKKTE